MKKDKILILSGIILVCVILGGLFYWYQWRPAQIRHDCSGTKMHSDAVMEMTQQQADIDNQNCINTEKSKPDFNPNNSFNFIFCDEKARSPEPAKDWYEAATKDAYEFCLHNKGL